MQQKKVATIFLTTIFALLLLSPILTRTVSTFEDTDNSLKVSVSTYPTRIQEGDNTNITIEINQAESNAIYNFEINVTNPSGILPAANVAVTTNATGFGNSSTEYWRAFTENANTDYVGEYFVNVKNLTTNENVATTSFTVGLTDKLKYARNDPANVHASGYETNESVTINIKLNETQIAKQNITASIAGIVNYTWQIPENATPGVYTVSITNATSPGTVKNPPDVQDFYVEVWTCQIQARNLANEPIANLTIRVYNDTTVPTQFLNLSQPTNETGWTSFMLATGNYTFKAFWKQVEVGNLSVSIRDDIVLEEELQAQLSNLKVTVMDEATNEYLPFIQLRLEYNYTTEANETITETSYFETNFTGTVHIHNLFINISYIVEAKRYGLSLPPIQNKTLPVKWNAITIRFPVYTAFIHVVDSKNNSIEGARVEAYEWSSGLIQSKTTGSNGSVTFSLTFGRYRVRVSNGKVLLNETIVDLTQNQSSFLIYLSVYNIDFTVAVFDYFGRPIPKAVVKVEQKTTVESVENTTGSDGRVTFSGILGGDSRISIHIGGQFSGTKDLYLTDSKQVTFNLNRYVVIAGYAVETSQFVTAIAVAILVVVFIVALTYKRLLKIFMKSK